MTKNARWLLTFFEEYYGEKYAGVVLDTMAAYLEGKTEAYFKAAASVLVRRFSRTFNKAPGPAELEKYKQEIIDTIPYPQMLPMPESDLTSEERASLWAKLKAEIQAKHEKCKDCKKCIKCKKEYGPMGKGFMQAMDGLEAN